MPSFFIRIGAAALAAVANLAPAVAQDGYPTRPVKFVVGFPAGGPADLVARLFAEKLGERLQNRFIVENIPGASSNNAAAAVARAEPDGYTLLSVSNVNTTNVSLYRNLRFSFPDDFEPVALTAVTPGVLVVGSTLHVASVRELILAAKARPGQLTCGHAGVGTGGFMSGELLKMMAKIDMQGVPYRGSNEALPDLLADRISVVFTTLPVIASFRADERLKVVAVSSEKRTASAPDLPTIAESGLPGFDVTPWFGIAAPKGTPRPVLEALAEAVDQIGRSAYVRSQLEKIGGEYRALALADFGEFMARDVPKWAKVVEFAGAKPQ